MSGVRGKPRMNRQRRALLAALAVAPAVSENGTSALALLAQRARLPHDSAHTTTASMMQLGWVEVEWGSAPHGGRQWRVVRLTDTAPLDKATDAKAQVAATDDHPDPPASEPPAATEEEVEVVEAPSVVTAEQVAAELLRQALAIALRPDHMEEMADRLAKALEYSDIMRKKATRLTDELETARNEVRSLRERLRRAEQNFEAAKVETGRWIGHEVRKQVDKVMRETPREGMHPGAVL